MTDEERNLALVLGLTIIGGVVLFRLFGPSSLASTTPANAGTLADEEPPFVPGA
jgi:hypothetical protein